MLNGKLSIERTDNGWILSWFEDRSNHTQPGQSHREVYNDPHECMTRLTSVAGMEIGLSAARALLDAAASITSDPSVDRDVAALMPDHAPASAYAGD